jgi:hypothetical protein
MIKLIDLLNEAPIGTYTTIGDFEKGASYKDPRDRAAVSHPSTVQKVKDMLKNTIVDFDFYFVNKPGLRKFSEKGKVPYEFIFKPQPDGLGLTHEELGDRSINSDNITVFFVSNTAADKIPMTAWTIVHRVGHAMNRTPQFQEYTDWLDKQFDELLALYGKQKVNTRYSSDNNDYKRSRTYELAKGRLFNHIGTMRSAREGRIHLRPYEFYYELFVQFLKDGEIKFNPLTKNILVGYGPYGSKSIASTQNLADAQEHLNMIANTIPYYVEDVLRANVGDIFVM